MEISDTKISGSWCNVDVPPYIARILRMHLHDHIGEGGDALLFPGRLGEPDGGTGQVTAAPADSSGDSIPPVTPGLTINAAISERLNEHGKCTAPGHLSATGSIESALPAELHCLQALFPLPCREKLLCPPRRTLP